MLGSQPDFEAIGDASSGSDALRLAHRLLPDVLLLNIEMPDVGGTEVVRELAQAGVKTVILTGDLPTERALVALRHGVRGVLRKDAPPALLLKCVRCVANGELWIGRKVVSDLVRAMAALDGSGAPARPFNLTSRESEVLALIVAGNSNKDIAQEFNLSVDTVKHHLTNIFDKTGVSSRLELAMFAVHHGLA